MIIQRATSEHVDAVGVLFDLYRQFYQCEPDLGSATQFIADRINNDESIIFVAIDNDAVLGFTQLYPSFCSVELCKIFILYDLYVDETGRNKGIGRKLMDKAREYAEHEGARRLDLLTEHSNKPGQHLYEKIGYKKVNEDLYAYSLHL